ncbi:Endophilin-A2 [Blomia tropicalis]|nr:Endophilin-A2 [Blomia tropicalis]
MESNYMSEKIGGAEGTKFTDDYTNLERKTDMTNELVDELINKTKEYLQPNPASRTKLMVSSKLKGVPGKPHSYPQPEGVLGEVMCKYGKDLGDESNFAQSLIEMGEAMKELSEVKYALEDNVKQNFLEPLTHLQAKDLKDVLFHRKKLEGRRLDYDCKKRKRQKGTHITEEEIKLAEDKFEESFNLASMGMHNLLQNEIEQLSQICVLAESLYEYHTQCANVLESLNSRLMEIKNEAAQRSFQPYVPMKLQDLKLIVPSIGGLDDLSPGDTHMNGSNNSKFHHTTSYNHNNNNHITQTHNSQYQSRTNEPRSSLYPNLHGSNSSSSSSSSWANRSKGTTTNNHRSNGVTNSTTAYLLSGKAAAQRSHLRSSFSKSIPNVSDLGVNNNSHNYFDSDRISNSSNPNSFDLLGSIENETTSPLPSPVRSPARTPTERGPSATALYDFDAENENELSFKEGDLIQLVSKIDENWYEGSVNGRTGLFPVSYVQVVVPLQSNGR